jgi:16S rRNA (cytosine1402-N4)-methyltransferase
MTTAPMLPRADTAPHVPVMLAEVLEHLRLVDGETLVDGTFGAGGYSKAALATADCKVIAIDRDPNAIRDGQQFIAEYGDRLCLEHGRFSEMIELVGGRAPVDAVVLDIGVSSMQIDDGARGFSFMKEGPLDMRMSQAGKSAADVVAQYSQEDLANVIFVLGEETKSRAIARAIVAARAESPITTTLQLVKAIERATGPQRAHMRTHPATRTFQALRIYVNGELDELAHGLHAAEALLREGGRLVVVTFHSLEDRIVKRFFASRSAEHAAVSRHTLGMETKLTPTFALPFRGHIDPTDVECDRNPRARSAKLRAGVRTATPSLPLNFADIGVPTLSTRRH